jgi:ribosomal protein S18 acetylase RimI-like enzyme
MASSEDIKEMEYLTAQFWPARETERYKGWILNWNDGITWRANCVLPLGSIEEVQLEEAIRHVIEFYNQRGTPPAFKITEASEHEDTDKGLADMGFEKGMLTHVQTMSVDELSDLYLKVPVDIIKVSDDSIYTLMYESGMGEVAIEARRGIINRIEGDKGIARVMIHGKIAGVGLGVVREKWLGLFSIRTIPAYQRRGVGWSVACALGMWGKDLGAVRAFIQVEANNTEALRLYKSMGFETMYDYWYRIL